MNTLPDTIACTACERLHDTARNALCGPCAQHLRDYFTELDATVTRLLHEEANDAAGSVTNMFGTSAGAPSERLGTTAAFAAADRLHRTGLNFVRWTMQGITNPPEWFVDSTPGSYLRYCHNHIITTTWAHKALASLRSQFAAIRKRWPQPGSPEPARESVLICEICDHGARLMIHPSATPGVITAIVCPACGWQFAGDAQDYMAHRIDLLNKQAAADKKRNRTLAYKQIAQVTK